MKMLLSAIICATGLWLLAPATCEAFGSSPPKPPAAPGPPAESADAASVEAIRRMRARRGRASTILAGRREVAAGSETTVLAGDRITRDLGSSKDILG